MLMVCGVTVALVCARAASERAGFEHDPPEARLERSLSC
jgi:hypothetical protein